jgi:putative DNA primase/helicase
VSNLETTVELSAERDGADWLVVAKTNDGHVQIVGKGELTDPNMREKFQSALCRLYPAIDPEVAWNKLDELARTTVLAAARRSRPTRSAVESDPSPGDFDLTDTGNAERLIAIQRGDIRYCTAWGKWLVWDGARWIVDEGMHVLGMSKEVVHQLLAEARAEPDLKRKLLMLAWAKQSASAARRRAMVDLARAENGVLIAHEDLDRHPLLLNCPNGTVDLASGELREHRREDLITRLCPTRFDPDAKAPTWEAFLERVLPDDDERAYFHRFCGYELTGLVVEHVMVVAEGEGANGKTTTFRVQQEVLSTDYAIQIAADLLTAKAMRGHPTEVADLYGKRVAIGVETSSHQVFDEAFLKQLTGGDRIRARRMREDHWEFEPTHKLVLITNHLPKFRQFDYATWRRLHRLRFTVTIPEHERDPKLVEKLLAEREGILAWMVRGCSEWQRRGLDVPSSLRFPRPGAKDRTSLRFIKSRLRREPGKRIKASDVYGLYVDWCRGGGWSEESQKDFGVAMGSEGYGSKRSNGYVYLDVALGSASTTIDGTIGTVGTTSILAAKLGVHTDASVVNDGGRSNGSNGSTQGCHDGPFALGHDGASDDAWGEQ